MVKRIIFGFALLLASASVSAISVSAIEGQNNKKTSLPKVTLCHATHSATNPYIKITVSAHAAGNYQDNGKGDHAHHTGPVPTSQKAIEEFKANKTHWGDIIPAGRYNTSLNWTSDGQAVFNNNCKLPTVTLASAMEDVDDLTAPATELPQTGNASSLTAALVVSGLVYAVASFRSNIATLYRRYTA